MRPISTPQQTSRLGLYQSINKRSNIDKWKFLRRKTVCARQLYPCVAATDTFDQSLKAFIVGTFTSVEMAHVIDHHRHGERGDLQQSLHVNAGNIDQYL